MVKMKRLVRNFRTIAIAEGISFLILLGIAMPMKYFADTPEAVMVFGWMHGILFIVFLYLALGVKTSLNKNFGWLAKAFLAAILPFGTFVLDRELKKEEKALVDV